MSHTFQFEDGVQVVGNADWSGMMEVRWFNGRNLRDAVCVPGFVLRAIIQDEGRKVMREALLKTFGLDDLGE